MTRSRVRIAALAAVLCAGTMPVSGQSTTAQISGSITDTTGAVVVGASITVLESSVRFARKTASNETGYYALPLLPPGVYTVRVAANELVVDCVLHDESGTIHCAVTYAEHKANIKRYLQ